MIKSNKKLKKTKNKKLKKTKKVKGGQLKKKCLANPENFPKCGKEGCVYLNNQEEVTKQQWKQEKEMSAHDLSVEGQVNSSLIAPKIKSHDSKQCDIISIKGRENDPPCFVKRFRKTPSGDKILYEEEGRKSWCQYYGKKNQCVVDQIMYDKFKNGMSKISLNIDEANHVSKTILPDTDSATVTGSSDSTYDDELGDLEHDVDIDQKFTEINPVYLTSITMDRVKGITINELISEMFHKLGEKKTMTVASLWEEEKTKLIEMAQSYGYMSDDFHEDNIMIDVDNEELCEYVDETLKDGDVISPEMIKDYFGLKKDSNILKIVDWGMLRRVKPSAPKGAAASE